MIEIAGDLNEFIKILADIASCSENIFWVSDPTFRHSLYVSHGYENILGRKPEPLYRDLKILNEYILPAEIAHHNPFIEMVKNIQEFGPEARYCEQFHLFRADGQLIFMEDQAQPVMDQYGQCVAITGIARDITYIDLRQRFAVPKSTAFPHSSQTRYYLKGKYSKIYLTAKEAECAFYFLQAKTQKEIAKKMNLSPRTVEHTVERIKNKFMLHYRTELYQALLESEFLSVLLCSVYTQ